MMPVGWVKSNVDSHAATIQNWGYLYDHSQDATEWKNLAGGPQFAQVQPDLAKWLPKENHADLGKNGSKAGGEKKEGGRAAVASQQYLASPD
jgi:hypothetical protein